MQQTFQRQFDTNRVGAAAEIKSSVAKEARDYFNKEVSLISELSELLDYGLTRYTAVYAPVQSSGGQ